MPSIICIFGEFMYTAEVRIVYGIFVNTPGGKIKSEKLHYNRFLVKYILIKLMYVALYAQHFHFIFSDINNTKASKFQDCT